jgi:translation initiation factor 2 beta subunit (eIF-2beta)/eIF-5
MQSVRLFVAGDGTVWALSKCRECGEVDKHLIREAMLTSIPCKRCGHLMDMKGATIEAVESTSNPPS